MIARWMIAGFVLWAALTLSFRFLGDWASWLFIAGPLLMFVVTHLLLEMFKVDRSDRTEAASIFALPGLLIGIYKINSFRFVFPNLDPSLGINFAAFMFACYIAVILAGLVASARWMIAGFVLWLALTLTLRFGGQNVFTSGRDGMSWMFLIAPLAMLVITYVLLRVFRIESADRGEAAAVFAVPGLLIGIYEIISFQVVFPNLDPSLALNFAALMFACFAAIIFAGIVSSRLKGI